MKISEDHTEHLTIQDEFDEKYSINHDYGVDTSRWIIRIGKTIVAECQCAHDTYSLLIGNLEVIEKYRRRGIAKAFLPLLIEWSIKQQIHLIEGNISKDDLRNFDGLIEFYKNIGFTFTETPGSHFLGKIQFPLSGNLARKFTTSKPRTATIAPPFTNSSSRNPLPDKLKGSDPFNSPTTLVYCFNTRNFVTLN